MEHAGYEELLNLPTLPQSITPTYIRDTIDQVTSSDLLLDTMNSVMSRTKSQMRTQLEEKLENRDLLISENVTQIDEQNAQLETIHPRLVALQAIADEGFFNYKTLFAMAGSFFLIGDVMSGMNLAGMVTGIVALGDMTGMPIAKTIIKIAAGTTANLAGKIFNFATGWSS